MPFFDEKRLANVLRYGNREEMQLAHDLQDARQEAERLRAMLRSLQWSITRHDGNTYWAHCPRCLKRMDHGHAENCPLAAALNPPAATPLLKIDNPHKPTREELADGLRRLRGSAPFPEDYEAAADPPIVHDPNCPKCHGHGMTVERDSEQAVLLHPVECDCRKDEPPAGTSQTKATTE